MKEMGTESSILSLHIQSGDTRWVKYPTPATHGPLHLRAPAYLLLAQLLSSPITCPPIHLYQVYQV